MSSSLLFPSSRDNLTTSEANLKNESNLHNISVIHNNEKKEEGRFYSERNLIGYSLADMSSQAKKCLSEGKKIDDFLDEIKNSNKEKYQIKSNLSNSSTLDEKEKEAINEFNLNLNKKKSIIIKDDESLSRISNLSQFSRFPINNHNSYLGNLDNLSNLNTSFDSTNSFTKSLFLLNKKRQNVVLQEKLDPVQKQLIDKASSIMYNKNAVMSTRKLVENEDLALNDFYKLNSDKTKKDNDYVTKNGKILYSISRKSNRIILVKFICSQPKIVIEKQINTRAKVSDLKHFMLNFIEEQFSEKVIDLQMYFDKYILEDHDIVEEIEQFNKEPITTINIKVKFHQSDSESTNIKLDTSKCTSLKKKKIVFNKEYQLVKREDLPIISNFFTKPDKLELARMKYNELENTKDFTIYNEYAKIVFPGKTNLTRLNIDEIIDIKSKFVSIYKKNPSYRHEEGFGLNKSCIIEVYDIFPEKDLKPAAFKYFLNEQVKLIGGLLISYDFENGVLTYKMNSFDFE